ncbi:MAG: tRNA (guanosine(46)-N7)-methyltransferase TrmB [Prevotella sp.]|nr:tRNA (guanosine(46)-N7)-methyltransferase TrmB [Prevotella sp.]
MGKGKLAKFADMETYRNVFQYPYSVLSDVPFTMRGHWREQFFHNSNPIILELGCGKGEYAVELAKAHPDRNYIGVDIKGARMWTGATRALQEGIENVAFLRTNIEIIDRFFAPDEVQEIWLTFSDPQMKNPRKRLTSTYFMERYRRFLTDRGIIHLKTDSNFLFTYTTLMVEKNQLPLVARTEDLYNVELAAIVPLGEGMAVANSSSFTLHSSFQEAASIQTYYEQMWLSRGISIKYMQFLLPHDGKLEEPDVEIELDEYRSYHRSKRSPLETRK